MCAARKFLFETSFDDGFETEEPVPEETIEGPAISPEEVETARAEGYAAGHLAATEEERRAAGRMQAEAAQALAAQIAAADNRLREISEIAPRQATAIALAVVRRILPEFVRREGTTEIEALIRECLGDLLDEPRLVVRVGEASFDAIDAVLTPLTSRAGFAGRVVLLAEESLDEGDCRIEWADGGAERNVSRIWREIDQAVGRVLATPPSAQPGEVDSSDGESAVDSPRPASGHAVGEIGEYDA